LIKKGEKEVQKKEAKLKSLPEENADDTATEDANVEVAF
jgi:hypothetical protein